MSGSEKLSELQSDFFRALGTAEAAPAIRGRFAVYRYAYFERIRASIEEDFPLLFGYLETLSDFPGGLDAEIVTRDLLERNHPSSWTLAEASIPVMESVAALMNESRWTENLREARRLAALDEAEGLSGWLEDWREPAGDRSKWVGEFAAGRLRLVRTKTWQVAEGRVFWRGDHGSEESALAEFDAFEKLFALVLQPSTFSEFGDAAAETDPAEVTRFFRRGIAEGWLRFTV